MARSDGVEGARRRARRVAQFGGKKKGKKGRSVTQ